MITVSDTEWDQLNSKPFSKAPCIVRLYRTNDHTFKNRNMYFKLRVKFYHEFSQLLISFMEFLPRTNTLRLTNGPSCSLGETLRAADPNFLHRRRARASLARYKAARGNTHQRGLKTLPSLEASRPGSMSPSSRPQSLAGPRIVAMLPVAKAGKIAASSERCGLIICQQNYSATAGECDTRRPKDI